MKTAYHTLLALVTVTAINLLSPTAPVVVFDGVLLLGVTVLLVRKTTTRDWRYRTLSRPAWSHRRKALFPIDPVEDMEQVRATWDEQTGKRLADLPYHVFLTTYYWRTVRAFVIHNAGYLCESCTYYGHLLEVHHEVYEGVVGRDHLNMHRLWCVCPTCHQRIHKAAEKQHRVQGVYGPMRISDMPPQELPFPDVPSLPVVTFTGLDIAFLPGKARKIPRRQSS